MKSFLTKFKLIITGFCHCLFEPYRYKFHLRLYVSINRRYRGCDRVLQGGPVRRGPGLGQDRRPGSAAG